MTQVEKSDFLKGVLTNSKARSVRGGRMAKSSRGIVSFAPTVVAGGIILMSSAVESAAEVCAPPVGGPEGTEMCDLGLGSFVSGTSQATSVSADGTIVVGFGNTVGASAGLMWTSKGSQVLAAPSGASDAFIPYGVSGNGLVVVGEATTAPFVYRAVRWTSDGAEFLPTLPGDGSVSALATDADGDRIVGAGRNAKFRQTAVYWHKPQDAWEILDLGFFTGGTFSYANAISQDGTTIVGYGDEDDFEAQRALFWSVGDGGDTVGSATRLEHFFSGVSYQEASANGVSADGTVIVGSDSDGLREHAVRWINGEVELVGSGQLVAGLSSIANAVNSDGTVVVGIGDTEEGERAFRWTEGSGMVSLGTLETGNYSKATAVSADGSVVVGTATVEDPDTGQLGFRAFIWRGAMQDYANLMASFPVLANETELAVSTQQWSLGKVLDQTAFVGVEGRNYFAVSAGASNAGSGALSDSQTNQVAGLTFGRGISAELTVGASLQMSGSSNAASGFDTDTETSVSVFAEYSKGGADRTGLQASLALGYATAGNTITRGQGFTDVEAATGNGDLETMAARVSIGYGIGHASGWLLTPHAAISQYSTSRGAYAEDPTATAFSAAYDELNVKTTVGTAGIVAGQKLNDASSFSLGAGVDFDINADDTVLAGSANIPGMEEFGVTSALVRNDVRPYVTADYSIDVASGGTVTASARLEKGLYGNEADVGVGVRYGINF